MTARQEQTTSSPSEEATQGLPALPIAVKDTRATRELMFTLRHFHLGDPGAKSELSPAGDDYLPALLDPFRDTAKLRYDYPLFLAPPDMALEGSDAALLARPLSLFLKESVASFAPGEDTARTLKDNLPWIERELRKRLAKIEAPVAALSMLSVAGQALREHLQLAPDEDQRLQSDLEKLLASLPVGGELLSYGRYAAIHLLIHTIRSRVVPRRIHFQEEVKQRIQGLKTLLEVEWDKSDEAIEPKVARDSLGEASTRFDPAALSAVMDHSKGSKAMSPDRRERIEDALKVLQGYQHEGEPILVRFVHVGGLADAWLDETPDLEACSDAEPCATATAMFDQEANRLARVFSAARIAQLEIAGIYERAIHDPWFASFNWEAFSQDELLLVPAVIALEPADRMAGEGLRSFSRLLSSGRPVHIMVRVQAHNNPGAKPDEDPFQRYRVEIGYLGIAHRQAVVAQSSAARHQHLLQCYLSALDATRTSLHIINTGLRPPGKLVPLNAWLVAGAALEGRTHPFFHINPEAGDVAAARMDFSGNPQAERDWPVHPFRYRDENGHEVDTELAFTFVDYALLIERLRDHFRLIPPECDSSALLPVDVYLSMDPEEAYQQLPFVWAVDSNAILRRLVVSRELILACRDRLNYWRTLQELAGIRNRYVELAIQTTRDDEQARAAAERERLQAEHAEQIERVRNAAAGEAMQRLSDVIMGMDLSAPVGRPATRPLTLGSPRDDASDAETDVDEALEPIPADEEEAISFDDPWIDNVLCTSCNDCTDFNPLLFVYNENKQAEIADLNAGTYAQLVEAAEFCPAHCIHPGKPLNPEEPGLEEWIKRAEPFNQ